MTRIDAIARLRNMQAEMAEDLSLIIEEIERMGADESEQGSRHPRTEDFSEMVDWCQDTEAPSRWRAPGTKDIGQKVRCSLWMGVTPEDMREGVLMDIRQDDRGRNEYLVKHPPNKNHRGFQQWWPVAWSRVAENPPADVIHIELVPSPEITDVFQVILRDGEAFIDPARVEARPKPIPENLKEGLVGAWAPGYITPDHRHVGQMVEVSDDFASWYPRKLLAVMALGGGFIVHALGEEAGVGMKKLHARVKA